MAILAEPTRRRRGTVDTLRAQALFASTLQRSEEPSADQVRQAVAATLRRLGPDGCIARLAGEFGDHPDVAGDRVTWALATVRAAYPSAGPVTAAGPRPLALAG